MAELVLSALLPVLLKQLASPELRKFAKREKVGDLVRKWETKLRSISLVLEDAEDKAIMGSNIEGVQPWLEDLKDLVYDIEDLVDEFVTQEAVRGLQKKAAVDTSTGKVRSLLPSCCSSLNPRKLIIDCKLRSRMDKIDGRLSFILEQKRDFGLSEASSSKRTWPNYSDRLTTSLPESHVVGRQDDENAILAKLLSETGDDQHLSVIPIVGMGGLGKTTLARSVYNNSAVEKAFPKRGWVCVSDNFNTVEIARGLLGSLGGTVDSTDLNVLHDKLREILSNEKFLIVLDDYWNENYSEWNRLLDLFNLGGKGSKVIVTTRLPDVASLMRGSTYHLRELSPSDCLSLLEHHALGGSSFDDHPNLKPIGEKIAEKCAGLPLAAKTLGGLLRSKSSTREWQYIRDSEIWNLPQGSDGILPVLKLSYFHLPPDAKRCFTFCSIFPQDYEFDRDELVKLWMAEGFVDMDTHMPGSSKRNRGLHQFNVLLSRSFFQPSSQNESRFVMHDLMHDLATSVGGITYLNVGLGGFDVGKAAKSIEKVRHLRHLSCPPEDDHDISARLEKCRVFKGLRTFISLDTSPAYNSVSNKVVKDLLRKLKYLRALSFNRYSIKKIPGSICYLKHLRYLNLSRCPIKELPETICTLYNLETLILSGCSLTKLPEGIIKLINLRCLDIRDTEKLEKMPVGLGHLHKLEILPKFIIGKKGGLRLNELKCLQFLQGEILISNLQNVKDIGDAREAEVIAKVGLTAVTFKWDVKYDPNSRNADKEMEVLNLLQPHCSVKEMKIKGFGGTSFPQWIGSRTSLVSITRLLLSKCRTTVTLPSLGLLPLLRELRIEGMDAVCTVGPEFFGTAESPFPSLEVLEFAYMPAWEVWSFSFGDKEIDQPFPILNQLVMRNCPELVNVFPQLPSCLKSLTLWDCEKIKSLPHQMQTTSPSLQSLKLIGLSIESLFPKEGGLPLSLDYLTVSDCKELRQPMTEWGLDKFTALKTLEIRGEIGCLQGMTCFPPPPPPPSPAAAHVAASNWSVLPPNLEVLQIWRQRDLVSLSNGLRDHLTSLRQLVIYVSPKLQILPKGGFPPSIEHLEITECSEDLKSKLSSNGEYFPLIERIPGLELK